MMLHNYDVAIVGRGPGGLSAAIYTARAGFSTIVLGVEPKAWTEHRIDNYFGFPEGIKGQDLFDAGMAQACHFGAVIHDGLVLGVRWADRFTLATATAEFEAPALLLATGMSRRKAKVPGLDAFDGRGVSYCVSCDGFFFRGKPVAVLGEGDYAASKALELLDYTPSVTLCTDARPQTFSEPFRARMAREGIAVRLEKVAAVVGGETVARLEFSENEPLAVEGVFVALGEASSADFARSLGLEMNRSYIIVNSRQETNIPGIWAAGDCTGRFLQVATAVGDGAVAAHGMISFLRERRQAGA
ncbi:MAG: NAD(P)/FAD-dependent oxidoreductase [Pseudomonadota bacterium]